MSPVTKGLLARNRKGSSLLPPSKNLLKPSQGKIKIMHKFYLAISIFFVSILYSISAVNHIFVLLQIQDLQL